jgi:DNA primase catalytic core
VSDVEKLRAEADLVRLIGGFTVLTKRGRSYTGLCPFHKEKTPSFHVNEERGFYHCFGCGESGDAIKFLREKCGMSFQDAVGLLRWEAEVVPRVQARLKHLSQPPDWYCEIADMTTSLDTSVGVKLVMP